MNDNELEDDFGYAEMLKNRKIKERQKLGIPDDGTKITFEKPVDFAFHWNVVEDQVLLEVGKEYTIRKVEIASSSTYVWLDELQPLEGDIHGRPYFSLWAFDWEGNNRKF